MAQAPLTTTVRYLRRLTDTLGAAERTDEQLLGDFVRDRDGPAFAALVRRYAALVTGVCRRTLRHHQDTEDAFQATFLVLAQSAGSIRRGESLAAWLYGVAHRVAMNAKRSQARRRPREQQTARTVAVLPPDELSWREVQAVLDEEVQRLPEVYRRVFVECCLHEQSRPEAARRLGLKLGTVSSRLAKAKRLLQARLARRGVTLSALLAATGVAAEGVRVSAATVAATAHAAVQVAAGAPALSVVPVHVVALAKGVTRAMLFTKAKIATALLLLVSVVVTGSGLLLAPLAAQPERSEPQAEQKPAAAAKDEQAEPLEVKGRVHDPAGKPVAGARVFLWASGKAGPEVKTGTDGRFQLPIGPGQIKGGARLVAAADGFGPDWVDVKSKEAAAEVTLQLPTDDLPILGRVLDLEGRPVAGATVKVHSVRKPNEKGLSWWLEQQEKGSTHDLPRLASEAFAVPTQVAVGSDGRFRLSGFGRERVVGLHVQGPGVQQLTFWAVTRPEVSAKIRRGFHGTYPASFELLLGPGRAIVGTVREKGTGKPIAGATVGSVYYGNIYVTTDEHGRYRIEGVAKHDKYAVAAGGKHPYFNATKLDIPGEPGLEPITVDFELEKGIIVRGRLTEKGSGKPVSGYVSYQPYADNPHLKDYSHFGKPQIFVNREGEIAADGSFAALAIPGQGALCTRSHDTGRYLRKIPDGLKLGNLVLEYYHAIVPIEIAADAPQPVAYDITLEAGTTLAGKLLDPDGKPLTGAHAAGLWPVSVGGFREQLSPLESSDFSVGGLGSEPRMLFFFHPEKRLAKVLSVRGEDPPPLTVRLEPLGSVAGRVLDAGGKPRTDVKVVVSLTRKLGLFGKELPLDLLLDYPRWNQLLMRETTTGADGRFQLDGLVPGLKYHLEWGDGGRQSGMSRDEITVEPGKAAAVGDLATPAPAKEAGGK